MSGNVVLSVRGVSFAPVHVIDLLPFFDIKKSDINAAFQFPVAREI